MKTTTKTVGKLTALVFCLTINFQITSAQAPTGVFNFFGRGMYVDKFINVWKDAGNVRHVDDVYSILGEGTFDIPLQLYSREKELLEYCKQNHITYLVLYELPILFANTSSTGFFHSNGASLEANLCRFMQSAKDNYCVEAFGAAIGRQSEYQGISDFNAILIPPLALTSAEQTLIGNAYIISAIENDILQPGDPLYQLVQYFRLAIHVARFNVGGSCPNFDVLTTEKEFWHTGYGTWAEFTALVDFLYGIFPNIEAYTFWLHDAGGSATTPQQMADYMDGTSTLLRKVNRILESDYKYQDNAITNPFTNNTFIQEINSKFKTTTTNTFTVIHPSFTCEDATFYDFGSTQNYEGYWMMHPSLAGGTTPNIARNIFTIEKYYYDDWRSNATAATDTSLASENRIRPGATHWFTSNLLKRYYSNPAVIYRTDQNACVTTSADVQFSYCGPIEKNTLYTLKIYNPSGGLMTTIGPNTVNKIEDYSYPTTSSTLIDPINLTIPGILSNSSGPYKAEMQLDYYNHDGGVICGTYTYSQNFWVDAQPHVILNGDAGGIHNVCSDDYVILIASVNVPNPQTDIKWYRSGTAASIGSGEYYTLNYYDYDNRYTILSPPGSYDFYYTVNDPSCGGLVTSAPITLNIKDNSQVNSITSVCTPGTNYAVLTVSSNYAAATFLWCDGNTSNTTIGYHGGKYSVVVTQEGGCTRMATVIVPGSHSLSYVSTGGCNYTITDTYGTDGDGHMSWYIYNYVTAAWDPVAGSNHTINATQPGYYTSIYTYGTPTTCRGSVPIYVGPVITNAVLVNPNCSPVDNGSITLSAQNVLAYSWNPNVSTTNSANNLAAGSYTVTITNGTCSVPYTYNLTNTTTVIGGIQSQTTTLCPGESNGTATATGAGGTPQYAFAWDDGETTALAVNLNAGIHTCIVTDANGCQGIATVTILDPSLLTISVTSTDASCIAGTDGAITVTAGGGTPSYSYYANGNTSGLHSSASNTISLLEEDTYTVYFVDANGCISTSVIVTIGHSTTTCCNYSPQLPTAGNPTAGTDYNLNTSFTISSGTYIINDNDIAIKEGVSITVTSGASLEVVNTSHLFACGDMWQGIILNQGALLIVDNSTIEDAIYGFDATGPCSFEITNSTFDNNFVSVLLSHGNFLHSYIRSSHFKCSDGTLQKMPYAGTIPFANLQLGDVNSFKLGDETSSSFRNYFSGALYGLYSLKSVIEVVNNNFDFGVPYDPSSPARAGINIVGLYSFPMVTYNVIGKISNYGDNYIANYGHGILARGASSVEVRNNYVSDCLEGTTMLDVYVSIIFNNYLFNYNLYSYLGLLPGMIIGIDVESSTGTGFAYIGENYIYDFTTGIHVNNIPKANVGKNNRVYMYLSNTDVTTYSITLRGIWIQNSNYSSVALNNTYRSEDPDATVLPWIRAIDIDNTQGAYLYGNNLRKTGSGIRFISACTGTELHCNVLLDCFNGVFLDNSSQSNQGTSIEAWDNYWNNQVDPTWKRVDGQNWLNVVDWYYNSIGDNNYNTNPHTAFIINDFDLTPHSTCPDPTIIHLEPDNRDELSAIANGSLNYEDFQNEITYTNREFFYDKLKADTTQMYSGLPTDALFQQLYNQLRSGSIGLFSEVKDMVKNNDFAQAYLRNQLVPDASVAEYNKKAVNEIFLYCQLHDTVPDSAQIAILENIAYQFPIAGGEGVYMSRAMLHLHIEDQMPLLRKARHDISTSGSNNNFGVLYPNPASTNAAYRILVSLNSPVRLSIIIKDAVGKQILTAERITTSQITINTSILSPGVYYYHIFADNSEKDNGKLVIVK